MKSPHQRKIYLIDQEIRLHYEKLRAFVVRDHMMLKGAIQMERRTK